LKTLQSLATRFFATDLAPVLSLTILSVPLFFTNLGVSPFRNLETKWAAIAREMVQSRDFITPTINGIPYLDKPNLSYWLMVLSSDLFGGVNELTVRIPVAVSGVLSILFLYAIGKRLFDRRVGWVSAWILATAYFYIFWGRSGSADTMTVCGELLTLWIFLRFKDSPGRMWLYFFYASMSVNSLTKGLLGFVLPLLVVVPYSLWTKQWKWLFNKTTIPAGAAALFIYVLPFIISSMITGSFGMMYKVYRENIQRFFDPFDHHDNPVYFYFYDIIRFFAPWSVFLPFALYAYLRPKALKNDGMCFTMIFFVVLFAFFTASGSRRSYYILPAVPATALLVGKWWGDLFESEGRILGRFAAILPIVLFWTVVLTVTAIVAAGPAMADLPLPASLDRYRDDIRLVEWPAYRVPMAALVLLMAVWSLVSIVRNRAWSVFLSSALAVTAIFIYYSAAIIPIEAKYLTAKPFDLAARAHMGDGAKIAFYRHTNTREIYYVQPPIQVVGNEKSLLKMAADKDLAYIITEHTEVARLKEILPAFRVLMTEPHQPFRRKSERLLVFLGPN
jgi:hypothetical protein